HLPPQAFQAALVDTEVELGLEKLAEMIGSASGRVILVEFSDEPIIEYQDMTRPTTRPQSRPTLPALNEPIRGTTNGERTAPLRPQPGTPDLETTARRATAQT